MSDRITKKHLEKLLKQLTPEARHRLIKQAINWRADPRDYVLAIEERGQPDPSHHNPYAYRLIATGNPDLPDAPAGYFPMRGHDYFKVRQLYEYLRGVIAATSNQNRYRIEGHTKKGTWGLRFAKDIQTAIADAQAVHDHDQVKRTVIMDDFTYEIVFEYTK
jgi:hypothetical protein